MKKIKILIIIILSIVLVTTITLIIVFSNMKKTKEGYHTILENKSYVYEENRKMTFNVYSDTKVSIIGDVNNNSYILELGSLTYTLDNISVRSYGIPNSYLFKIDADIPNVSGVVSSDLAKLIIYTSKNIITLKLGSISILNPNEYELLGFDRLYASYCMVDGYKQLVGINIKFNKKYDIISDFKIGEYCYGNLNQIRMENYENEIDIKSLIPEYNITRVENSKAFNILNTSYFIPINYTSLMIIKEGYITLKINNVKYYIDTFSFMTNDLDYDTYKDVMKEGIIS